MIGERCERCGKLAETEFEVSCWRYLCGICWPAGGICADCRAAIEACGCERGCARCGRSTGPRPAVEVQG